MKSFLSLLFSISLIVTACAQKTTDQILLKNNTVVIGKIIEKRDSISVKIELSKNNVAVIPWTEISSIVVEVPTNTAWQKQQKQNKRLSTLLAKGYAGEISMPGYQYLGGSMLTAYITSGFQFNPRWSLTGGLGVEAFNNLYVPFFADARFFILQRALTPFLFVRGGIALLFSEDRNNYGVRTLNYDCVVPYLNAGVGARFKFLPHFGLNIKGGYRMGYSPYTFRKERYYSGFQWNTQYIKENTPSYLHGGNISVSLEF